MQQTTSSKAPSPHTTKDQPQQSKQIGKQAQSEKAESTPPPKDKSAKQTKPTVHGEGAKNPARSTAANQLGQQHQKMASKAEGHKKQTSREKGKLSYKFKASVQSSSGQKMTNASTAKHSVEKNKESLRANSEQNATDGSKPKLTANTRPEAKVNKEILAGKDNEKHVRAATTPEK
ncbi:hypothetical protein Cgig2_020045 [Carnegiea gigantea]|uniref:Uncharacterized protein n=1 Tax=Carnegiea gigantea TaxID=171969 RepID=A0A9Q1GSV1_9CARY|nr:hypothetical protein Cgig2_020045 [Carnegiea gigantea]